MPALHDWRRTACVCAFALLVAVNAPAQTFKIASWNIRSGKGIAALAGPRHFNSDTNNCTDPALPLNAWGIGVPQAELQKLNGDPAIVALALEEAWHCGTPARVRDALGWVGGTDERCAGTTDRRGDGLGSRTASPHRRSERVRCGREQLSAAGAKHPVAAAPRRRLSRRMATGAWQRRRVHRHGEPRRLRCAERERLQAHRPWMVKGPRAGVDAPVRDDARWRRRSLRPLRHRHRIPAAGRDEDAGPDGSRTVRARSDFHDGRCPSGFGSQCGRRRAGLLH
jgi:hypothetical protein